MTSSRNGRVQSVTRALQLLEALTADEEMGLMDLAKRTDLLPSTAHRLLATLGDRGYVYQNRETGKYLLSFRVLELAGHVAHRTDRLRAAARPFLERICRVCRETTNLVLLDQWNIVYVDQVLGERAVRLFAQVGRNIPAHTTGAGKAMLAFSAEDDLRALFDHEPFESFTPNTITTAKALAAELRRIRRRGYAMDNEEYEEGVTCVAAPIFDHGRSVCGAISVSGPSARVHRLDSAALGELIGTAAIDVSRELGFCGPSAWGSAESENARV